MELSKAFDAYLAKKGVFADFEANKETYKELNVRECFTFHLSSTKSIVRAMTQFWYGRNF
jgi:hypothetical protein